MKFRDYVAAFHTQLLRVATSCDGNAREILPVYS